MAPESANALFEATQGEIEFNMRNGVACLEFDRAAASLREAITRAITEVEGVGIRVGASRVGAGQHDR